MAIIYHYIQMCGAVIIFVEIFKYLNYISSYNLPFFGRSRPAKPPTVFVPPSKSNIRIYKDRIINKYIFFVTASQACGQHKANRSNSAI